MGDFKVGDKVRIKSIEEIRRIDKSLDGIVEEYLKELQGGVYTIEDIDYNQNICILLEDISPFGFKCDYLEKVDTFYKTLPNDYSGKLTIEKGQVIEKEDKKEILDEVEKELKENYVPKEVIRRKIKELENQKVSIKVGFEKIFETKMDNAKIIDTLRELLRGK